MQLKSKFLIYSMSVMLTSCGTYRYYQPSPNAALFKNEGEVHVSGDLGSSGASLKAAGSLPGNIGLIGTYNSGMFNYRVKEGELGVGYYTNAEPSGIFVCAGSGFGSNFHYRDSNYTIKDYEGSFYKPFVQFNGGIASGTITGGFKGDLVGVLKTSYLFYDGKHLNGTGDKIRSEYALIEPGFMVGLGSRKVKFDLAMSYPIHFTWFDPLNDYTNARTFPMTVSFGMRLVINRDRTIDP